MNDPRTGHGPSGAKLLNESKANPAAVNMDIFARRSGGRGGAGQGPAGQGTVNDRYLQETREQNPDPAETKKDEAKVSLAKCRFVTPVEGLKLNEPFEFAVDVKKIGEPKSMSPSFDLYCTRTRDGKPERDRIWAGQEGKPIDAKADPIVVQGKDVLATQADYVLGETVTFELEATHPEADQPAKSEKVEIQIKCLAHWVGGDDLFFRNDGEFPLLGAEGSLLQVLATAVGRIQKPAQEGETCICFGFASSAGEADPNRELSLRRAQVVKALLDRDEAAWVELAKANFETRDIQQFLSDLHAACGWETDPGTVDGQDGPKTKAAIEAFQKEGNARYKLGLKEDGVCGPKTWGAVHRVILGQVQAVRGEDEAKAPSWPKPKWGHGGKGAYGNGEDYATGGDKPEERSVQITFFAPGSEPPLKEVTDGQKASSEHNPVQQPDRIEKKKVDKGGEVKRGAQEPIEDGVPFYSLTTDELFILPKDKVSVLDREAKMMEMAMPVVGSYFFPDPGVSPEEARLGLQAAFLFMKDLQEAKSIEVAEALAKNAKAEIEARKPKVKQNPALAERLEVKGASMESGWYQKVLYADGKRMVWVRSEKIRPHARWFNRKQTQAQINKEMDSEKTEKKKDSTSKKPATSGELKLFEGDFFKAEKGTWAPQFEEALTKQGLKDSKHLEAGVAVQALRWAAEGKYGANISWAKDRTIKAEAKVEGSFNLISAQGHFDIHLTGKDGIDVIDQVKRLQPKLVRPDAKPIHIRASLTLTGSAFTGACGSASAGLGLAFKEGKKKEAGMEVGVEAFVGAKVGAEASMDLKMRLWEEKSPTPDWKDLSSVIYGTWAAIGLGLEASLKVGYFEERFRVLARLGLVVKGGAGHYLRGSLHAQNVAMLIWTVGRSVNWHEMGKILDTPVWRFYQMIMMNSAITGQTLTASANLVSKELDKLMLSASGVAVAGLQTVKNIDDTFDRYVPGYTIAKKFHPAFLLTKETYDLLKGYNQNLERGAAAINTVGKIKDWKYVTREVKHNMLVDLCQSGTGWLGPFSGEDKEDAIIKIMNTIRDKAEYDWIIEGLDKQGINLNNYVDFSQKSQLEAIHARFK